MDRQLHHRQRVIVPEARLSSRQNVENFEGGRGKRENSRDQAIFLLDFFHAF